MWRRRCHCMLRSASYLVFNELSERRRLGKQIYPLFLTLGTRTISELRALSERGRRGRVTEKEMTD